MSFVSFGAPWLALVIFLDFVTLKNAPKLGKKGVVMHVLSPLELHVREPCESTLQPIATLKDRVSVEAMSFLHTRLHKQHLNK